MFYQPKLFKILTQAQQKVLNYIRKSSKKSSDNSSAFASFVLFSCINYKSCAIQILHSNQISLKVVIEEFVITSKCENLLLFELSHYQLVHLRFCNLALVVHVPNLLHSALHLDFKLMFNHVKTRLKNAIHFPSMSNFNFLSLLLRFRH